MFLRILRNRCGRTWWVGRTDRRLTHQLVSISRLSVRPPVRPWRWGIGYFENNFTAEYRYSFRASARADPNMGNLVQWEHRGEVRTQEHKKICNMSVERGLDWVADAEDTTHGIVHFIVAYYSWRWMMKGSCPYLDASLQWWITGGMAQYWVYIICWNIL